jgi:hypothetical protein
MVLLTIIHYQELFSGIWFLDRIGSILGFGLSRHTWERILFIFPLVYGCITLGTGAGISLLVMISAIMLPRIFHIPPTREKLFETGVFCLRVAPCTIWIKEY